MAEKLKKLVKIRGGHRASLTKTLAVTEELLTQSTEIFEETQASDFEIKLTTTCDFGREISTSKEF
jgi:hypothetical protein